MDSAYLTDILIMLAAAVVTVPIAHLLRMGAVPGFLIAGVVVGPSVLGLIGNIELIGQLSEFGVVMLLFVIGIELKPSRFWLMRKLVFGLGSLQVVVTGFLIGLICHLVFEMPLNVAVLIGPTLALSSTAFVLQLLTEQKMLMSEYGRTSFAILLFQDLAVIPLLALASFLAMPDMSLSENIIFALGEALLILTLIVLVGRYLLQPLLYIIARSGSAETFTASALLLVMGTAFVTEHVGLSMAMGAFLAGLLIADSVFRHQVMAEIQPFRGLFLGLFFMSMGMSLNLHLLTEEPFMAVALVLGLILIKIIVLWPLTRLFGLTTTKGLSVSIVLAQSGEFALVLFALAQDTGILPEAMFQQLLLIVLLSMLCTQPLARLAQIVYSRQGKSKPMLDHKPMQTPIIIAGFGRVGHRVAEILALAELPFVAVDKDARRVGLGRAEGFSVFFGDVCRPDVLRAAGSGNAEMVIVTLDDPEATEKVVASLVHNNPKLSVLARGQDKERCRELRRLGATFAVSENFEASQELARIALAHSHPLSTENEDILERFRKEYYGQVNQDRK